MYPQKHFITRSAINYCRPEGFTQKYNIEVKNQENIVG